MNNFKFKILLSASVPSKQRNEKYLKIKNAQIQIEEAVISLSRNIFQAGGQIIFGGHPSISPLVQMVASEYSINRDVENYMRNEKEAKPINIFQSKAYENVIPEDVIPEDVIPKETFALSSLGYAEILWIDAKDGEKFNPEINEEQCKKSLTHMRREMIKSNTDAFVCIGGMEGVEEEFELFREYYPEKPIYILKSTGGASKILSETYSEYDYVKIIDKDYDIENLSKNAMEDSYNEFEIIPYSFFTALIIEDLLSHLNHKCYQ